MENTYLSTFRRWADWASSRTVVWLSAMRMSLSGGANSHACVGGVPVRELSVLVVSETLALVMAGLFIGVVSALVSIAPILIEREVVHQRCDDLALRCRRYLASSRASATVRRRLPFGFVRSE